MALYFYSCAKGHVTERVCSVRARRPSRVRCGCGKWASRDIGAEHRGAPHHPGNWPRLSKALGVMPHQVQAAEEEHRKAGVPLHFRRDGKAIVNSPSHQRELVKKMGWVDKDSYC